MFEYLSYYTFSLKTCNKRMYGIIYWKYLELIIINKEARIPCRKPSS